MGGAGHPGRDAVGIPAGHLQQRSLSMSEATLFVRKASGLVRSWSGFDAFVYATFSINLITLGLFIFSYCWYFTGNLGTAVVVGGVFTIFEVIVYASLISAMPRAGGAYVWQARILGRGIGVLLAGAGLHRGCDEMVCTHPEVLLLGRRSRPGAGVPAAAVRQ